MTPGIITFDSSSTCQCIVSSEGGMQTAIEWRGTELMARKDGEKLIGKTSGHRGCYAIQVSDQERVLPWQTPSCPDPAKALPGSHSPDDQKTISWISSVNEEI